MNDQELGSRINTAFTLDDQKAPKYDDDEATKKDVGSKSTAVAMPNDDVQLNTNQGEQDRCSPLQSILVAFLVIFVIAFAVILTLYVEETKDSDTPSTPAGNGTQGQSGYKTCLDEKCIFGAAEILGYMNRSANPCEDFYSFACGGWRQKTLMPPTAAQVHVLYNLVKSNNELLRNLLANPVTRTKYSKNRAVIKSIDFYQTCLSRSKINKQGDSYLKDVIKRLGGSNLTTPGWNSTKYDVNKATQMAFREFGIQPFFGTNIFADFANSSIRRFAVLEGGIVLANTFYRQKNSSEVFYSKTRKAYQEFMVDVMTLFGVDPQEAERQMLQVFLFEEKIAELRVRGPPMMQTLEMLSNKTKYDWVSFFAGLTVNQTYNLTKDELVLVQSVDVLIGLGALINNTDKAILSNYIAWTVIEKVIEDLPSEYGDARLAYNKKIHGSRYEAQERWSTCLAATKKAFPMPIGLIFVDHTLSSQDRERAKEIFEDIRREFLRELSSQTWMDEATRTKAREKAEASIILAGYPDFIKDEQKLHEKYNEVYVNPEKYLQTVFNVRKFSFLERVADLRRPVDKYSFEFSPADVNAYHYHQQNKNIFLAGILLPPFYTPTSLRASNYGGIGMVAGHELTHGFDSNGRFYDKNGNRANWWTGNSTVYYENKSKCLEKQYSQFELYGKKLNGKMTLAENIADNGGIKFAFKAYRRWVEKNGEEDRLPGLDFTPNQLFFISYAQGWCAKYTRQGALHQLDNQPWPPMNLRVEGSIKNSEAFAEAFKCKPGSPMNPIKKCNLW